MNNVNQVIDLPLRDIHLPDPISWWPLAVGWWLLIGGVFLFFLIAVLAIYRWKRPTLKKQAVKNLDAIEARFRSTSDRSGCIAEISVLLRRIVITLNPKSAGVTGRAWLELLDSSHTKEFSQGIGQLLLTAPYQPDVNESNVLELIVLCRKVVNRL